MLAPHYVNIWTQKPSLFLAETTTMFTCIIWNQKKIHENLLSYWKLYKLIVEFINMIIAIDDMAATVYLSTIFSGLYLSMSKMPLIKIQDLTLIWTAVFISQQHHLVRSLKFVCWISLFYFLCTVAFFQIKKRVDGSN